MDLSAFGIGLIIVNVIFGIVVIIKYKNKAKLDVGVFKKEQDHSSHKH